MVGYFVVFTLSSALHPFCLCLSSYFSFLEKLERRKEGQKRMKENMKDKREGNRKTSFVFLFVSFSLSCISYFYSLFSRLDGLRFYFPFFFPRKIGKQSAVEKEVKYKVKNRN